MSSPLSFTGKQWNVRQGNPHADFVAYLAEQRGIDLTEKATWSELCTPHNLGDCKEAVQRIRKALDENEEIGIIGDYDADGITGVAQLVRFFRRHGVEPHVILPHRQKHGYGVKKEFIDEMKQKDVTLVLTVDTGITAVDEVSHAKNLGIDVIITDHHSPKVELPDCLIVHPAAKEEHTNPILSGSGVAFTLIRALEDDDWNEREIDCALAAIGTVADVVPLLLENRTIVQLGLKALNAVGDHPLYELLRSTMKEGEKVTSIHIGFRIAPRINAAGRIADPHLALDALLHGGYAVKQLNDLNDERRESTKAMQKIAESLVESDQALLAICSKEFHPGIIGLIAGKLTERHGKPSLVGCIRGDEITCSLRSIPEYHIADALNRCSDHLHTSGGHAAAGGCTLDRTKWEIFSSELMSDAERELDGKELSPTIHIDTEINTDQLSLGTVKKLEELEPFGEGNPEPRFIIRNQKLERMKGVGQEERHLSCFVGRHKTIGFGLGFLGERILSEVDLVCRLGIDYWNGKERVQIFIEDIAEHPLVLA